MQAAQAMSAYNAWVPQEFDEAALDAGETTADASAVEPPVQPGNMENTVPGSDFEYDSTSGVTWLREFSEVAFRHQAIVSGYCILSHNQPLGGPSDEETPNC